MGFSDYVTPDESIYIPWPKVEKLQLFSEKRIFEDGMCFRYSMTL